jgi:hypothetical protein
MIFIDRIEWTDDYLPDIENEYNDQLKVMSFRAGTCARGSADKSAG